MSKVSFLVAVLTILLTLKLIRIFNLFELSYNRYPRHKSNSVEFDEPQTCHGDDYNRILERQQRIKMVRHYLSNRKPEDLPSENVVVFGAPGALSEMVSDVIGGEPSAFYLKSVLQSRASYIQHDVTLAIPLTIEMFDKLFKCEFKDKNFLEQLLLKNKTLLQTIQPCGQHINSIRYKRSPSNFALDFELPLTRGSFIQKFSKELHFSEVCLTAFSQWLTAKCRHSDVKVLQTNRLKSISYLETFAREEKSRRIRFQVIHVVRDPRSVIYNITKTQRLDFESISKLTDRLCTRMRMNLATARSAPIWSKRYHLVRIEHFFRDFIAGDTYKEMLVSLNEWQIKMDLKVRRLVESVCATVIELLGYK